MSTPELERISTAINKMETFATHYDEHVVPHICRGLPLFSNCKFCQSLLKKKER